MITAVVLADCLDQSTALMLYGNIMLRLCVSAASSYVLFSYHRYANDTQFMLSFPPSDARVSERISERPSDISTRMASRQKKLNTSKNLIEVWIFRDVKILWSPWRIYGSRFLTILYHKGHSGGSFCPSSSQGRAMATCSLEVFLYTQSTFASGPNLHKFSQFSPLMR